MVKNVVSHNMLELSFIDIQEFLKKSDLIMIPMGSCEMHGPHLPAGTDSFVALETTKRAAEIADVIFTPVLWCGYSPHHLREVGAGMGTITLRSETYQNLLYDIARCVIHQGFSKLIFVTGHASNMKVVDPVMRKLRYGTGAISAVFKCYAERNLGIVEDILEGSPEETPGWHAGELETAQILAYDESLVRMDRAVKAEAQAPDWLPEEFGKKDGVWDASFKGHEYFYFPMEHNEFAPEGIMGNPFRATKEKGNLAIDRFAQYLADAVDALKKMKVEIKEREFLDRV